MTARQKTVEHLKKVFNTNDLLSINFKPIGPKLITTYTRGSIRLGSGKVKTNEDVDILIDDFINSQVK